MTIATAPTADTVLDDLDPEETLPSLHLQPDLDLKQFMERFQDSITHQVIDAYEPTYQPDPDRGPTACPTCSGALWAAKPTPYPPRPTPSNTAGAPP